MPARSRNPGPFATLGEIATAAAVKAVILAAARQYGVDPALALAIAQRESGLNPQAVGSKGEKGVMQLMPATAKALGVTDLFNVAQNVYGGVSYLAQLLRQFGGDAAKAVAAYNCGPGCVSKAVTQHAGNWLAAVPAGTRAYVAALLGVTPTPPAPAAPGVPPGTYTTIDAATGKVVDDPTDVSQLPAANDSGIPAPGQILLLGLLAAGAWLAADLLAED